MVFEKLDNLFFPHDNKTTHFKALDGLRGIAVLIVLLSHSSNVNITIHERINFQGLGTIGVYLFFVLSAYLLDSQIVSAYVSEKVTKAYWKNYFLRRFLRIYPLFIIALFFLMFISFLGFSSVINNIKDFFLHISLLKGDGIFWSIPVEFKYYFISPILIWFCHRYLKWNQVKLFVFFTGIILLTVGLENYFHFPRNSTLKFFPIFMVGTIISISEYVWKNQFLNIERPWIFNLLGWLGITFVIIASTVDFKSILGYKINFLSPYFYFPYAMVWGMLLLSAKYGTGIIRWILEIKFIRFIGSISFSLYLFHLPFISLVQKIGIPSEFQFYVFMMLTILFSSFSYLIIERPLSMIKLKNGISDVRSK